MNTCKKFRCLLGLGMALLLLSCTQMLADGTQYANATPSGTPIVSAGMMAETMIADPNYMSECKGTNSVVESAQVGYHGIFPGQSTATDVENKLGNPKKHNRIKDVEEWVYDGFNVYFDGSSLVESVAVHEDPKVLLSLKGLISKYGCPDIIFAIDMSIDRPSGAYSMTEFTYLGKGMKLRFLDFPVPLSAQARSLWFIQPQTLLAYLEATNFSNYSLETARPVSWSEAVQ